MWLVVPYAVGALAWSAAVPHRPASSIGAPLPVRLVLADEAELLNADDARLLQLTPADVRARPMEELEELLEELEAAAANYADASGGTPSLALSKLLATAHTCYGDHENCVGHARAALSVGGEDSDMRFLLGVAYERGQDEDEALAQYEAALDLNPDNWRALFHVGKIALNFGAIEMGIEHLRKVSTINPDHAPTRAFLATFDASDPIASDDDDEDEESVAAAEDAAEEHLPLPESMQNFDIDPEGL